MIHLCFISMLNLPSGKTSEVRHSFMLTLNRCYCFVKRFWVNAVKWMEKIPCSRILVYWCIFGFKLPFQHQFNCFIFVHRKYCKRTLRQQLIHIYEKVVCNFVRWKKFEMEFLSTIYNFVVMRAHTRTYASKWQFSEKNIQSTSFEFSNEGGANEGNGI